jgi:hypothetical protein
MLMRAADSDISKWHGHLITFNSAKSVSASDRMYG